MQIPHTRHSCKSKQDLYTAQTQLVVSITCLFVLLKKVTFCLQHKRKAQHTLFKFISESLVFSLYFVNKKTSSISICPIFVESCLLYNSRPFTTLRMLSLKTISREK